jgi:hypothetical protein
MSCSFRLVHDPEEFRAWALSEDLVSYYDNIHDWAEDFHIDIEDLADDAFRENWEVGEGALLERYSGSVYDIDPDLYPIMTYLQYNSGADPTVNWCPVSEIPGADRMGSIGVIQTTESAIDVFSLPE